MNNNIINQQSATLEQPRVLEVKNLCKTFEMGRGFKRSQVHALRDVSFDLHSGRALALVGESGSGKSTVARLIMKMYEATSGEISYAGQSVLGEHSSTEALAYRRAVQMVFQDPFGSLNPAHRIFHHIARPLLRHGHISDKSELKDKVFSILSQVELDPQINAYKFPHQLSGGQRQRVALARTLAVAAKVVLADEPTSMLDVSIRIDVLNLLKRMKDEQGIAFLYITHDIATARYFAEDIAVLYQGQIVEWGASAQVIDNPQHFYTKLLLSAVPDANVRFDEISPEQDFYLHSAAQIRQISGQSCSEIKQIAAQHFIREHDFSALNQ
ncbi:MAG: peptide ABC transporter, ATP-binding protein [Osedax symbiont Rs2]|nr:MAG: peptide ABC transporter, ATP-binding protein [Osedax symbiont Rs2]